MTRHFQILISENMPSNLPANTLIINEFSKIQNLLGQEFETILFDARKGIHLEALAIAAGTLKMNGSLIECFQDIICYFREFSNYLQTSDILCKM